MTALPELLAAQDEIVEGAKACADKAVPGPYGIMLDGPRGDGKPWQAHGESRPGLTVGSIMHTEPVARMSGYLMPVQANAEFLINARVLVPRLCAIAEKRGQALRWLVEAMGQIQGIYAEHPDPINGANEVMHLAKAAVAEVTAILTEEA